MAKKPLRVTRRKKDRARRRYNDYRRFARHKLCGGQGCSAVLLVPMFDETLFTEEDWVFWGALYS